MSRFQCNSISCCCIFFFGLLGCGAPPVPTQRQKEPASTSVHLVDLAGNRSDFWHDSPEVAVAIFTRTDCPISNRYAPEVRRLYDRFHPHGVVIHLIYVDPHERPADIRKHLQEYHYPCPALIDPDQSFAALCHATVTPEAIVFNKNH